MNAYAAPESSEGFFKEVARRSTRSTFFLLGCFILLKKSRLLHFPKSFFPFPKNHSNVLSTGI